MKTFADKLKERMEAAGITSTHEMKRRGGPNHSTTGDLMEGRQEPTIGNLQALVKPLGVSLFQLMLDAGYVEWEDVEKAQGADVRVKAEAPGECTVVVPADHTINFRVTVRIGVSEVQVEAA